MSDQMQVWAVVDPRPVSAGPLVPLFRPVPEPGPGEIRLRVSVCGVCRTDLHLAEGDLPPHRSGTVPGHEAVGVVDALGAGCRRFRIGQRAGIAWLRSTCGACSWCRGGAENLCPTPRFTGWDTDGGYAQCAVVDEAYAYELPEAFDDEHAAPLLCAGIIGYRALRRAELPPGGRLGIYGFGASAHLAAQVALAEGAVVHVLTRSADARRHALDLGVHSAGPADAEPPEPLDAAILFARQDSFHSDGAAAARVERPDVAGTFGPRRGTEGRATLLGEEANACPYEDRHAGQALPSPGAKTSTRSASHTRSPTERALRSNGCSPSRDPPSPKGAQYDRNPLRAVGRDPDR